MARKQDENTDDRNRISSTCGQNVAVNGNTAEWCSIDSGGRLFVEQSLTQKHELVLKLTESGHADVGILTVNPNFLSDVKQVGSLSEFTLIQNAKLHHQDGRIHLKRSQNRDQIVCKTDGENQYYEVNKSDDIWITVNIIYGTLKVQIDSDFFKISAVKRGENISISSNQREAHLNIVNPCAVCFFERPIMRGETLCFSVEPIVRDGRATHKFSFKVGITEIHPEGFLPVKPYLYDITFLPVSQFENSFKKVQGEIALQCTTEGVASVQYKRNKSISQNITFEKSYLLIELCKVKLKYLYKRNESLQTEPSPQVKDTTSSASLSSIDYTNVPDGPAIPTGPSANVPDGPGIPTGPSANVPDSPAIPTGPSAIVPDGLRIPSGPSANVSDATASGQFDSVYVNSKNQLALIREEVNKESLNENMLPGRGEKADLGGIYKRLQSIEERLCNNTSSKDASLQQTDTSSLESDIKEIKRMLEGLSGEPVKRREKGNVQNRRRPPKVDKRSVYEVIRKNFTEFITLLDTVPFMDRMFERDHLTFEEYERIRISSQTNRVDANRDLSSIIFRRQSVDLAIFKQYLIETKQDGVYSILFPK